jgi:hypothetical protein
MLRRKFMQMMLVASSSSALALMATTARASGNRGASKNDSGASVGRESNENHSETRESHSSAASVNRSESNENHSSGASVSHSEAGGTHSSDYNGGASVGNDRGASVGRSGSASVYCSTDPNGQQTCQQVSTDGLETVTDSDLDDVLQSFN